MTIPKWLIWLSKNNLINLTMAQKRSHKFDILLSKSEVLNSPRKKPSIIQDCIQPHEGRSFSDIRLKDTSRRMPALLITMSTRPYLMTISCWVNAWSFLDCRKPWVLPAKYRGVRMSHKSCHKPILGFEFVWEWRRFPNGHQIAAKTVINPWVWGPIFRQNHFQCNWQQGVHLRGGPSNLATCHKHN